MEQNKQNDNKGQVVTTEANVPKTISLADFAKLPAAPRGRGKTGIKNAVRAVIDQCAKTGQVPLLAELQERALKLAPSATERQFKTALGNLAAEKEVEVRIDGGSVIVGRIEPK